MTSQPGPALRRAAPILIVVAVFAIVLMSQESALQPATLVPAATPASGYGPPTPQPSPIWSPAPGQQPAGDGWLAHFDNTGPLYPWVLLSSVWVRRTDSTHTLVYGGAALDPTIGPVRRVIPGIAEQAYQQGAVVIVEKSDGITVGPPSVYHTPGLHGGLRIMGAEGSTLIIRAADGSWFTFDADERQFRPLAEPT